MQFLSGNKSKELEDYIQKHNDISEKLKALTDELKEKTKQFDDSKKKLTELENDLTSTKKELETEKTQTSKFKNLEERKDKEIVKLNKELELLKNDNSGAKRNYWKKYPSLSQKLRFYPRS